MERLLTNQIVAELLYREGLYLDQQRWSDWLDLFAEDCELWVPSWVTEHELIEDPQSEISLLYLNGKNYLQERADRIVRGASPASVPMPRTCHQVNNILVDETADDALSVQSVFRVDYYHHKKCFALFGHYHHTLVPDGGSYRIQRKKVILMNDFISEVLDVYLI